MVTNLVGPVARGENCFGRDDLVNLLWNRLENGNVLLAAPRRFGKTSVMYRLIDAPRPGYRVIHVDLEHMAEPADLVTEMFMQLAKDPHFAKALKGFATLTSKIWSRFRESIQEVEAFNFRVALRNEVRSRWRESGDDLFERAASADGTVVFIFDEFPMMVDRMAHREDRREEARDLLRWLRKVRQSDQMRNLRFLLAGSIGISHVLNQLGEIASINDFEIVPIEAFTPKAASAFLDELAKSEGLGLSPACKRKILSLIETRIPFFLQILFSEVWKASKLQGAAITPKMIESVYHDKVLGVDCKTYFDHYYGRLRAYYMPQEEKAAKRILRALAIGRELSRDACFQFYRKEFGSQADTEDFNRLMTDLENDFYVRFEAAGRRFQFACSLLRDWWLRHYAMETED